MRCPLCCSNDTARLEQLSFDRIKTLYRRRFQVFITDPIAVVSLFKCRHCDLKFYDPSASGSPGFYEALSKQPWYYLSEKREYELALEYVSETDSVLEIGAGVGAFAEKLKVSKYAGLELNDAAVAKRRG